MNYKGFVANAFATIALLRKTEADSKADLYALKLNDVTSEASLLSYSF